MVFLSFSMSLTSTSISLLGVSSSLNSQVYLSARPRPVVNVDLATARLFATVKPFLVAPDLFLKSVLLSYLLLSDRFSLFEGISGVS